FLHRGVETGDTVHAEDRIGAFKRRGDADFDLVLRPCRARQQNAGQRYSADSTRHHDHSSQLHLLLLWRGRMNACAHSPLRATQPPSNRMGVSGAISDNSETEYARLYKQSVFCAGARGSPGLSRDSQFGQRIMGPLAVEICDGVVDGVVERDGVGEGLGGEVRGLEGAPDRLVVM